MKLLIIGDDFLITDTLEKICTKISRFKNSIICYYAQAAEVFNVHQPSHTIIVAECQKPKNKNCESNNLLNFLKKHKQENQKIIKVDAPFDRFDRTKIEDF